MTNNKPDLRTIAEQLARLIEVSLTLNSTLNLEELLQFIIHSAADILDCESVSILLYDDQADRLNFVAASGVETKELAETSMPLENSLAGTIFRDNKVILLSDIREEIRKFLLVSQFVKIDVKNLLGMPMRIKDKPTGVLEALNKRTGVFDESDADILAVIASHAAVAIHNARLVEELQEAYNDLQEADRLKTNFLALASHELRTPLGVIIGYATFLQQESQGKLSEHANQVLNAAMQMRALVDAMTNMDMLRTSEMIMSRTVVPVQQVLMKACDEIKTLADVKNQVITLDLEESPLPVKCDPEKLISAFVNLLENAVRFTPERGRISVGTAIRSGGDVLCWVEDNGVGIPHSDLRKIFKEFYQVEPHTTRTHGGMGIGLSIAKGLIEAHGGKVWAESPGPGKGSTFKVLLPYIDTSALQALNRKH